MVPVATFCTAIACIAIAAAQTPIVIAHRGASGLLPEHTLEAYTLAIAQGAHYIEPDVVMTKDDVLICLHDLHLDRVTDVKARWPTRKREDGRFYAVDFTLAEIKSLQVTGGQAGPMPGYQIATLDELIALVQKLESALQREIGIIPELKGPSAHQREGKDLAKALREALARAGYTKKDDRAILQCFELETLKKLHREGCRLRLVWLVSKLPTAQELKESAAILHGLGPNRRLLDKGRDSELATAARAHDLALYPWTFDADEKAMRRMFHEMEVAGLFTDFPAAGLGALTP